jgi:hypothetical protein
MPLQGSQWLKAVPWDFLAPHQAQAVRNHSQSLETLAQRGGLCPSEVLAVIEQRRWRRLAEARAEAAVIAALGAWLHRSGDRLPLLADVEAACAAYRQEILAQPPEVLRRLERGRWDLAFVAGYCRGWAAASSGPALRLPEDMP